MERLGARGDGIGTQRGRPVYLFDALPGELVEAEPVAAEGQGLRARRTRLLEPAPQRQEAPCPHFGTCGGCDLQQLRAEAYRAWKRGLLVTALQRRGFEAAEDLVAPLVATPPGRRRRVTWSLQRRGRKLLLGFRERASHRLVDQTTCLQLLPELNALAAALRTLLAPLLPDGAEATAAATATDGGLDLLLTLPAAPDLATREALAGFAEAQDLARLSLAHPEAGLEPLAARRAPLVRFAGIAVVPPPQGFLQPSKEGEAALTAAVLEALPDEAARLADLYAGCGTFTLPLIARGRRVLAIESEAAPLAALEQAARSAGHGSALTTERRDLERRPPEPALLAGLDALVFDPPRAGAAALSEALAEAGPPRVVAISCNPQSFARDARILAGGGYGIDWVRPVDQFPWTHHLELVARFSRR